jgi:hypothetical protein
MRKDMFKVIVERPRAGGKWSKKQGREKQKKHNELPKKQGMKRAYRNHKSLNENLKPLQRFLRSRAGKPWDKVYSEICDNLKVTSTVQQHVRDHLKHLVHFRVDIFEKRVYYKGYSGWLEVWDRGLYVHPKSGLLREYRRPKSGRPIAAYDPFIHDLNRSVSGKGEFVANENDVFLAVYSSRTSRWSYTLLNATHARHDFKLGWNEPGRFIAIWMPRILKLGKSQEYFGTLADLHSKHCEDWQRAKAAEARKKVETPLSA